jgi:photosynthetic reaction center H subunit
LADGGKVMAPDAARTDRRAIPGEPVAAWPGAPLEPTGNPFDLGVGPGSWAARADKPDMALDGKPKIMAMRVANGFSLEARDPDPRGMPVVGADGVVAGKVVDVWVDRAEVLIRYLEVDLGIESSGEAEGEAARTVLLPVNFAVIDGGFTLLTDKSGKVYVEAINGDQFAGIPVTKNKTQLTMLEEEKIVAYFGAGTLYADAKRAEPWL